MDLSDIYFISADPNLTEKDLDEMIMDYHRHCTESRDDFEELGWPRCSYTVSKLAVNAYTRILQKEMEDKGDIESYVYNSLMTACRRMF